MKVADRPPRQLVDLEGTLDTLRVIGMDAGRGLGIDSRKVRMQGRPAALLCLALQPGTHRRISRRHPG